jgi:hypothetical protein
MKPFFLHIPNCSPEEVAALRSLIGRRLAITEIPLASGSVADLAPELQPLVRAVNVLPSHPEHGVGSLVVVEFWADAAVAADGVEDSKRDA